MSRPIHGEHVHVNLVLQLTILEDDLEGTTVRRGCTTENSVTCTAVDDMTQICCDDQHQCNDKQVTTGAGTRPQGALALMLAILYCLLVRLL